MNFKFMLVLSAVAFNVLMSAAALTEREWIGPDGGSWANPKNWQGHVIPGADEGVNLKGGTIVLDSDVTVFRVVFSGGNKDKQYRTKIVGNGFKIVTKSYDYNSIVWPYHHATLDNVVITSQNSATKLSGFNVYGNLSVENNSSLSFEKVKSIYDQNKYLGYPAGLVTFNGGEHYIKELDAEGEGAKVVINNGSFPIVSGSWFHSKDGGVFEFNGGYLTAPISVSTFGRLTMNGGVWEPRCMPYIREDSVFSAVGGKIKFSSFESNVVQNEGTAPRLISAIGKNVILESPNHDIGAVSNSTLNVSSTLIITNAQFKTQQESVIKGGGNIYANRFRIIDSNSFEKGNITVFEDNPSLYLKTDVYFGLDRACLIFSDGVKMGSMGNWKFPTGKNGKVYFGGEFKIDTSDIYGATAHSVICSNMCARHNASVMVTGGGTALLHFANEGRLTEFSVDANTAVALNSFARADCLKLGVGASLKLTAGLSALEVGECAFAENATIQVEVPAGIKDVQPILVPVSASVNFSDYMSRVQLVGLGADTVQLQCINGCIVVVSSLAGSHDYEFMWTGSANDGMWNTESNWNNFPVKWKALYFSGTNHISEIITNISGTIMHNGLHFVDGLSPFVLKSNANPFELSSKEYGKFSAGISSMADCPVTIDGDVIIHSNNNNPCYTLALVSLGRSYIHLKRKISRVSNNMEFLIRPMGDIRFEGEVLCSNVMFSATSDDRRYSAVTVLNGAKMDVRTQCSNLVEKGVFRVNEGGQLSISGARYRWMVENDFPHEIDGIMTVTAPIASVGRQTYCGGGVLNIGSVISDAEGTGELQLAGNIEFRQNASWATVTSIAPNNPITLSVVDSPVIKAVSDWSYGPDSVQTDTTESDRALKIAKNGQLCVDSASHTVTFADPVQGDGSLKIVGGIVKFLSAENYLYGGLNVDSGYAYICGRFDSSTPFLVGANGKAVLSGTQNFASVSGDGVISFTAADNAQGALLSVAGTADLTGLSFEFDTVLKSMLENGSIDLVEANEIVLGEEFADKFRFNIVSENGIQVLKVRKKMGTVVIMR